MNAKLSIKYSIAMLLVAAVFTNAMADSHLHEFVAGTSARAVEVMDNFNNLDSRLEAELSEEAYGKVLQLLERLRLAARGDLIEDLVAPYLLLFHRPPSCACSACSTT